MTASNIATYQKSLSAISPGLDRLKDIAPRNSVAKSFHLFALPSIAAPRDADTSVENPSSVAQWIGKKPSYHNTVMSQQR